jgi:small-conductance mechanosensitive channel
VTNIRGDAFLELWDVFKANGIEIPYPHRQVLIRPPDALHKMPID